MENCPSLKLEDYDKPNKNHSTVKYAVVDC